MMSIFVYVLGTVSIVLHESANGRAFPASFGLKSARRQSGSLVKPEFSVETGCRTTAKAWHIVATCFYSAARSLSDFRCLRNIDLLRSPVVAYNLFLGQTRHPKSWILA
jgi:hypothetical protein